MADAVALNIDRSRPQLQGFDEYYTTEIAGWMAERVDRHRKAKTHCFVIGGIGLLLVTPLLVWAYFAFDIRLHEFWEELPFVLLVVFVGLVVWWAIAPLRKLQGEVKGFLLDKVCGFLGLTYRLKPEDFPFASFDQAGLMPGHHRCKLEDNIAGTHDDVAFDLAECRLERRQRTRRGTNYVQVYHGVLFRFTFPKRFEGKTLVSRDAGAIGNFFKGMDKEQRIHLEDPRFEKLFAVYATDQVEARYLLTPALMERIMALAEHIGQKSVEMAFLDDHLLLSIRVTKDQFEGGGMFQSMTDAARIEELLKEICLVYDVIDTLKINIKTRV